MKYSIICPHWDLCSLTFKLCGCEKGKKKTAMQELTKATPSVDSWVPHMWGASLDMYQCGKIYF